MDSMTHDRWLEVSFYFFCIDIMHEHKDIMNLMGIIEALGPIGHYDVEPLKATAQQILMNFALYPTREELAILMYLHNARVEEIRRITKLGRNKIYDLGAEQQKNPRMFFPRLNPAQLENISKFTEVIQTVRKAGIYR